jgi:hypothetical protein
VIQDSNVWKTWYTTALSTLGAIGLVAASATRWGLYPVGVIVLLCAAVVGLGAVAFQRRQAPDDPAAREHDRWVVREVRQLVTRENVQVLTEWDFGGSWRQSYIDPFMHLARIDDVEHRSRDEALGNAFRMLMEATHAFLNFYALNTWHERGALPRAEDWRNVGWSGGEAEVLQGEARAKWNERARQLEALADDIGAAYDDFIDRARRAGVFNAAA